MKKVAVFGGSFDPPHLGHEQVIREVLESKIVDEIWLLPVKNHPFAKNVSPAKDRLAMVQLMLTHLARPEVRVEEYELTVEGINYSYLSLQHLKQQHPDTVFHWLMGSDLLADFSTWEQADELVNDFSVLVYPRSGYGWEQIWPGMTALTTLPTITVSSTTARAALAANQDTASLVLPEVAAYSKAHHLY